MPARFGFLVLFALNIALFAVGPAASTILVRFSDILGWIFTEPDHQIVDSSDVQAVYEEYQWPSATTVIAHHSDVSIPAFVELK